MPRHYRPNTVFESLQQAQDERERARERHNTNQSIRERRENTHSDRPNYPTLYQYYQTVVDYYRPLQIRIDTSHSMTIWNEETYHHYPQQGSPNDEWYRGWRGSWYESEPPEPPQEEPEINIDELKAQYNHSDSVPDGLAF